MYKIYIKTDSHQIAHLTKGETLKKAAEKLLKKFKIKEPSQEHKMIDKFGDPGEQKSDITMLCKHMYYAYGVTLLVEVPA